MQPQIQFGGSGAVATNKSESSIRRRYRPSTYVQLLKMGINAALHYMARVLPGGRNLRIFLHRLRGVKIGHNVFIGDDVYLDEDYPHCVEIQDNVVIAARCSIIAQTRGPGKIIIERNVAFGAGCLVVCAVGHTLTIGEGAVISAGSTVSSDIPPHTLCGPPRIKAYGTVTVPFTIDVSYEQFRRGIQPMRPKKREAKPS
jgi:heptaprenylglycerol acetyltransferase